MSTQVQFRRGTTAQTATFTGASAEITIDTTKNTIVVHDGSTAGGFALARESALSSNAIFAQAAFTQANAAFLQANTPSYTANSAASYGNSAFATANSAGSYANSAFAKANTDFTNVPASSGFYGNTSAVIQLILEANGRISQANTTSIAIAASQITSGTLGVARGGTGAGSFTTNGVLLGQGTSALTTASSSTEGHVLTINASGVPTFAHLQGGTF